MMVNEEEKRSDNKSSANNGGYKPKSNGYQGKRPDNRSNNRNGYRNDNRSAYPKKDNYKGGNNNPQKTDENVQHKSIKKEILNMIDNDTTDDDIKLYALSSMFVGTQIEELTKTLRVLTKKMEEESK